jgi:hypothetical protein
LPSGHRSQSPPCVQRRARRIREAKGCPAGIAPGARQPSASVQRAWKIARRDDVVLGFTDQVLDLRCSPTKRRVSRRLPGPSLERDVPCPRSSPPPCGRISCRDDAPRAARLLPRRASGSVPAARPEHARGVQPELPGRPRRPPLQVSDPAARAGAEISPRRGGPWSSSLPGKVQYPHSRGGTDGELAPLAVKLGLGAHHPVMQVEHDPQRSADHDENQNDGERPRAPICCGTTTLNSPVRNGIATKKIMMVPCELKI